MTESNESERRAPDRSDGEDVGEVERGKKDEKGTMEEEVERAQEREEEATEG